jgi:hypothetical protein
VEAGQAPEEQETAVERHVPPSRSKPSLGGGGGKEDDGVVWAGVRLRLRRRPASSNQ